MTDSQGRTLESLDRAVHVLRSRTSHVVSPNPAVASDLWEQARATYDLLPEETKSVCWLRGVERAR